MADVLTDNEMIIDDMDNFDFLALDDVKQDANLDGYATKQTGRDLMDAEDIEALEAENEVDEDEVEDEDTEDEEVDGDNSDNEEDEDESDEEASEVEDSDGEEVDFETYEVTLPDGTNVVLSDAIKGYKNAQALEAERAEFEATRNEFATQSESVTRYLELAQLEADRVIEDYKDFDWAAYKKDDPVGYVENREFLDRYKARRSEIVAAMDEVKADKERKESAEFQEKAREAGVVLARDIPGWNNDMYQQLMMYAVENGASADDIANSVDPVMFKILHKAMQHDKGKQIVKAKVKKIGGPKKVVKAGSKPTTTVDPKSANKKAILKKMNSGGLSDKDLSNTFAFLED